MKCAAGTIVALELGLSFQDVTVKFPRGNELIYADVNFVGPSRVTGKT